MKLSEIIAKYTPLGWHFEEDVWLDTYWTFKSSRMKRRQGFDLSVNLDSEINEDDMLKKERTCFISETYSSKIIKSFYLIQSDIFRQLETLDEKGISIPEEIDVKFILKLK